jgi:hypothetical protein
VIRHDAQAFRPNHEACLSFCKYLKIAQQEGEQLLAKRVRWGQQEEQEMGLCFDDGYLEIEFRQQLSCPRDRSLSTKCFLSTDNANKNNPGTVINTNALGGASGFVSNWIQLKDQFLSMDESHSS